MSRRRRSLAKRGPTLTMLSLAKRGPTLTMLSRAKRGPTDMDARTRYKPERPRDVRSLNGLSEGVQET